MNASGTNQPPDGTFLTNDASRRTFLKGVGLAGAAGLTGPFLASTRASAATVPVILGANAPGPWSPIQPQGTKPWPQAVPGALGCRSYRDTPFSTYAGCPTAFPGEQFSKPVASIRPDPAVLLNPNDPNNPALVQAIRNLIKDGAEKAVSGYFAAPPQLTVWHEAGHLYKASSDYAGYGLQPLDDINGFPTNGAAAQRARSMHVMMKSLCDQVKTNNPGLPHVDYGCIIYGDMNKMANDNDLQGPTNWVPEAKYPMDWYGIDIYRTSDGAGKDCTHDDLTSYDKVSQVMGAFHAMVMNRSPLSSPHINVCECNADIDTYRSQFFTDLAAWLHNNDGRRMLTFWHDDPAPHGGPWSSAGAGTIQTLNNIVSLYP